MEYKDVLSICNVIKQVGAALVQLSKKNTPSPSDIMLQITIVLRAVVNYGTYVLVVVTLRNVLPA